MTRSYLAAAASATPWVRVLRGVVLPLLLVASVGGATQPAGNEVDAAALRASQAAVGRETGDHQFIDQHGKPLSLADLRGRPLLLSLVFTNCVSVCSGQTLHLREVTRIAREALGARSFAVLTVGFDSAHDRPDRMLAYGIDRGIDDPDWHFASADAATVRRLTDEVGFTWLPSPRGFDHITQVTILDANGTVAQQVYGQAFSPPDLIEPLKALLLGRPVERTSLQGLIERVRLYCSVYDPVAGRYRADYSMFAAAIPALLVFGMVAVALILAGRRNP
ncbi:MAG: SCO family protein [Gammaproteobacteria bacterium]|nr:SCO family protein [Gammaproteobacteria bacterium]MDH4310263.1 SCO family protein [Gammaproteobacteria bacterium]MDH5273260.1 SCO family protein [Gammaproteobacteria bacterium]